MDFASEIDPSWLDGVETIGLTSGASVPEILVREVIERLAELGFDDVEEVRTTTEKISFSLPKNLRADLMAAQESPATHKRREPAPATPAEAVAAFCTAVGRDRQHSPGA